MKKYGISVCLFFKKKKCQRLPANGIVGKVTGSHMANLRAQMKGLYRNCSLGARGAQCFLAPSLTHSVSPVNVHYPLTEFLKYAGGRNTLMERATTHSVGLWPIRNQATQQERWTVGKQARLPLKHYILRAVQTLLWATSAEDLLDTIFMRI